MNKKGVTISTMAIAITIIMFLAGFSVMFGTGSIEASNIDKLNSVLDIVEDNTNLYYLENKTYPVLLKEDGSKEKVSVKTLDENFKKQIATVDKAAIELTVLDMKKLKIPNLEIGSAGYLYNTNLTQKEIIDSKDVFLLNENTGTIYYYKGIKFKGDRVYTNIENTK